MRTLLLSAALLVAACAPGTLPPKEVRDAVAARTSQAGLDINKVMRTKGLFTEADLTPETAPDIVVDYTLIQAGQYCGTGGCPLEIWVKRDAGPYVRAFDRQVLDHAVKMQDGRTWLRLNVHGIHCGLSGADPCEYAFEWSGAAGDPNGAFHPASVFSVPDRYVTPLLRPLSDAPVTPPPGVAERLAGFEAACRESEGATGYEEALSDLPDVTGDGRRDLLLDGYAVLCKHGDNWDGPQCGPGECGAAVFTQDADGGPWRSVFEAPRGTAFELGFSSGGAVLKARAPCADCALKDMHWDAGAKKLVLAP